MNDEYVETSGTPRGDSEGRVGGTGRGPINLCPQIDVPPNRVSQIIAGKRSVTGDTALRFGHWFGVDPQFWLNLQTQFDLADDDEKIGAAVRELRTSYDSA